MALEVGRSRSRLVTVIPVSRNCFTIRLDSLDLKPPKLPIQVVQQLKLCLLLLMPIPSLKKMVASLTKPVDRCIEILQERSYGVALKEAFSWVCSLWFLKINKKLHFLKLNAEEAPVIHSRAMETFTFFGGSNLKYLNF